MSRRLRSLSSVRTWRWSDESRLSRSRCSASAIDARPVARHGRRCVTTGGACHNRVEVRTTVLDDYGP